MWFRLQVFENDDASLSACVGKDGIIYWRATDIGRILGYACPSQFAKGFRPLRHARDMVPSSPLFYSIASSARLFTTHEMITLIRTCQKASQVVADAIDNLIVNGYVRIQTMPYNPFLSTSYRTSPILIPVPHDWNGQSVRLSAFLVQFTITVLKSYQLGNLVLTQDETMDTQVPSSPMESQTSQVASPSTQESSVENDLETNSDVPATPLGLETIPETKLNREDVKVENESLDMELNTERGTQSTRDSDASFPIATETMQFSCKLFKDAPYKIVMETKSGIFEYQVVKYTGFDGATLYRDDESQC